MIKDTSYIPFVNIVSAENKGIMKEIVLAKEYKECDGNIEYYWDGRMWWNICIIIFEISFWGDVYTSIKRQ